MVLAFDVGNSNVKIGILKDRKVLTKIRLSTVRRSADEYYWAIQALLEKTGFAIHDLRGGIITSVVPSVTEELEVCMRNLVKLPYLILGPGIETGLTVATERAEEVGADLLANAAGAYSICKDSFIVVSFGTATTFTCVECSGGKLELLGVVIAAGLDSSLNALVRDTALLKPVQLEMPRQKIGRNTREAVRSGVLLGHLGAAEKILGALKEEMGDPVPKVLTTGYWGGYLSHYTSDLGIYEENLLFLGLAEIWERNQDLARDPSQSGLY